MTRAQRVVLEYIKGPRHLSFGASFSSNHYFFNGGGGPRIHANTGWALLRAGWIKELPRLANQPYWRTDFDMTDSGRAALQKQKGETS